jgi:integrase
MLGAPGLARAIRDRMERPPIKISDIRAAYKQHSPATEKAKKEALAPFDRLVQFCDAMTLEDLTEAKLTKWRDEIVNRSGLTSSATISVYFSRVRNVLRLASRGDLDAQQIEAVLARCKAKLYSPPNNTTDDPHPISREDFHKLLIASKETDVPNVWRAILLMGLNAALYMEDICDLQWEALDLDAGTFVSRRKKTGKCIRVASLWPETVKALRALPRRGKSPYVFTSPHGTRYNKNTKINDFKDLRVKAKLQDVTFSHLRDGAYTAAAQAVGVDEKFARLLAGHKSSGLQDKYVARNPAIVKPATDAVYAAYGPFPM